MNKCLSISIAKFALLCLLFFLAACAAESTKRDSVSLCDVAENPAAYQGEKVSMTVQAVAAAHEFSVALTNPSCPNRAIFLSAGSMLNNDSNLNAIIRALYPGYPQDDGYSEKAVGAHVVGVVLRRMNRDLLMTYLEIESITPTKKVITKNNQK